MNNKGNKSEASLESLIRNMEYKLEEDGRLLKQQVNELFNSIKPANLLKNAVHAWSTSTDHNPKLFKAALGMSAGYLAKMIFVRSSKNPFRKLIGSVIMMGVTSAVSANPEIFNKMGASILGFIRKGRAQQEDQAH